VFVMLGAMSEVMAESMVEVMAEPMVEAMCLLKIRVTMQLTMLEMIR